MALITEGSIVGQVSGRVASVVYSRNRGGSYVRNGTIPITVTSAPALNAKALLGALSAGYRSLTDQQRQAWREYALANPQPNRLGKLTTRTAAQVYVGINARLTLAGSPSVSVPPVSVAPGGLTNLALGLDIGAGDFEITFDPDPLGADRHLYLRAAVVGSAGITYVQNLLKLITVAAADTASGYDFQSDLEARFGSLQVGQKVVVLASVLDGVTGLLSAPARAEGLVVST